MAAEARVVTRVAVTRAKVAKVALAQEAVAVAVVVRVLTEVLVLFETWDRQGAGSVGGFACSRS